MSETSVDRDQLKQIADLVARFHIASALLASATNSTETSSGVIQSVKSQDCRDQRALQSVHNTLSQIPKWDQNNGLVRLAQLCRLELIKKK